MGGVIPFDFESHAMRSVVIEGRPWFVAADVCRILEIKNHRDAVAHLDDDERDGVGFTDAIGRDQVTTVVSESGLYGLSARSNKPVAKRFWKWVRSELLPALIRDGYYVMPGVQVAPDDAELAAKRAYFEGLPERHKARARANAAAVRRVEDLIAAGSGVGAAIAEVAEEVGLSWRTLYTWRRLVWPVAEADWPLALAPRWSGPRGMISECHPEALRLFLDLRASGARYSDSYRRMQDEAQAQGWAPVPPIHTLRRAAKALLPRPSQKKAVA